MKLVIGGKGLDTLLTRLMNDHEHIAFAVAWASVGTTAYASLLNNRDKIKQGIIGTHFYQTHPNVLDDFTDAPNVQFVLQPQGVFHPKVYLFWTDEKWELLIGSANLTAGALTRNSELMMHVTSEDTTAALKRQVLTQITEYWSLSESVDSERATGYRAMYHIQQSHLKRVSGHYGGGYRNSPPVQARIMRMSWSEFFETVKTDPHHGFEERCALLRMIGVAFRDHIHFKDMETGLRQTIAGVPNQYHPHWAWFGSMSGAGSFRNRVNTNNEYLSSALDRIPIDGAIARASYDSYVEMFVRAFPDGHDGIAVASRLLAMKRPDWFVCFDSRNRARMSKDFGIKQKDMNYARYWDDIIARIQDSVWWNEPQPIDPIACQVWMGRAAMLDAIFYEP